MRPIKKVVAEKETDEFTGWFESLDKTVKIKVRARLLMIQKGHFGNETNLHYLSDAVYEAKAPSGCKTPWRFYFFHHKHEMVVYLIGGNKNDQNKDIEKAKKLAEEYKKQNTNGK